MNPPPEMLPWLDDVEGGAWIARSLYPDAGTVSTLVPPLFDSYVRVSVPTGSSDRDGRIRDRLIHAVRTTTMSADHCTFGVCEVYGWTGGPEPIAEPLVGDASVTADDAVEVMRRRLRERSPGPAPTRRPYPHPMLEVPLRRYMLYRGAVEDARRAVAAGAPRALPDLWWPDDRSWFIATDTDLDVVVLAGPPVLTEALATFDDLHVRTVGPRSPLV